MFDTHAHLHDAAYDADREAVLGRAWEAGVSRILTVGCDLSDSKRALQAAGEFGLDASVGIHPHESKEAPADIAAAFDELVAVARREPIAIGETGLDYYYDHSPRQAQQRVLVEQLRYARSRRLPLIFHQRDAFDDFVAILRAERTPELRGVVHCFTGDAQQARLFVEEFELLLGIGGVVTFKTAQLLRDAVRSIGLEHVILETDCPYLAPVPHRGKRNEPAFIAATAKALADLLDVPLDDLIAQTTRNAERLFPRHSG
ncbi:MAG TPA: TatD family hydrolase [Candidatus Acidoferrales bacterium]|nr:TatD family hydrolase [Candidatus Acidoferrales bacterium]